MNKTCARCEKTVYPTEELKCLDKVWHKGCFKCQECGMTLNMRTYKGYGKLPYCESHVPKAKHTTMAETPELKRIAENTKLQSNVTYHADFERSKGKFTQVADDPETLRIKANTRIISNVAYHGDLEKKAQMEKQRQINENGEVIESTDNYHQQIDSYANEMLSNAPTPNLPPKNHYQTPAYQPSQPTTRPQKVDQIQPHKVDPPHQQAYKVDPTHQQAYKVDPQQYKAEQQYRAEHAQYKTEHYRTEPKVDPYQQKPDLHQQKVDLHQQKVDYKGQQYYQQQTYDDYYNQYQNQKYEEYQNQHHQNQQHQTPHHQNQTQHVQNHTQHVQNQTQHVQNQTQHVQNQTQHLQNQNQFAYGQYQQPNYGVGSQQKIGRIQDYDPLVDGPRTVPNTQRASSTLIYNSTDKRGAHQSQPAPHQTIGRVTDMDPPAEHRPAAQPHPANQRVYIAMYDYEANDSDEVSFREGDLISNVTSIDEGWMTGQVLRTGRAGMLPANYVELAHTPQATRH